MSSLLFIIAAVCQIASLQAFAQPAQHGTHKEVFPILEFPEPELDDTATYQGYATRFFRDSDGNAVQISINQKTGRVVHLWADGANESISFTARTIDGSPAQLQWGRANAKVYSDGKRRYLQYVLTVQSNQIEIGLILSASMRIERDFQYFQRQLLPFTNQPVFIQEELVQLINNIERLPNGEQQRHLTSLGAVNVEELRSRLVPRVTAQQDGNAWTIRIEQLTFDGKNLLSLELSGNTRVVGYKVSDETIALRSAGNTSLQFTVTIGTDSPSLIPLDRNQIFNADFWQYYERVKKKAERSRPRESDSQKNRDLLQLKRLERQIRSIELLSYHEKLMAGLPNFATYFGRDMIMSALMLEPVWSPDMLEHVINSVLRKLSPNGEVSHEEALGGQAIREHAAEYNKVMSEYFERQNRKEHAEADRLLARASIKLENLQSVRENYIMLDDDLQFPVLVARYLPREDVPADRKRAFLESKVGSGANDRHIVRILRNLVYVCQVSHPYVNEPSVHNLVGFPRLDEEHWFPGSWRDSRAGYANGRFAMDVNAIWVPKALESVQTILSVLQEFGYSQSGLESLLPEIQGSHLQKYIRDPAALAEAIRVWSGAKAHFAVTFTEEEVRQKVDAKLRWLPEDARAFWQRVLSETQADARPLNFLALSIDEQGTTIPVANTDPVTLLFLENFSPKIARGETTPNEVLAMIEVLAIPYPLGLRVEGVGPVVANDVYASPEVWENFQKDHYHSPSVVWGREVNLFLLGLAKQIQSASELPEPMRGQSVIRYLGELRAILEQTVSDVEASGLKHNELWTYRIERGRVVPARYPTTSDIQLWNLTDLAVQFVLDRIARHATPQR